MAEGFRFPTTYILLRDAAKMDFGTINTGKATEGSATLGCSHIGQMGNLERYRFGTEKGDTPRWPMPEIISEFADDAKQEARLNALLYGNSIAQIDMETFRASDSCVKIIPTCTRLRLMWRLGIWIARISAKECTGEYDDYFLF